MTPDPQPFELLGPLPTGTTMLQASAGTGKTFTIAALVARFVVETTVTMPQLLVISFSRESTRELRERVRERLVVVRDTLHRDQPPAPDADALLRHLYPSDPHQRHLRHARVHQALTEFDAATVSTIHGFCQQALVALGVAGEHDREATLVEDVHDLVTEAADDLYLRKWALPEAGQPVLSRAQFQALAAAAAGDVATALTPAADAPDEAGLRVRIAHAVRAQVERRKWQLGLLSYDDLLLRLQRTLVADPLGPASSRLRRPYRVVLVDEFQDTDPVQWQILHTAFHGHAAMVLVADPKQAIYGFRGADVHAYLHAAQVAGEHGSRTLTVNHRSDARLLTGIETLFRSAALGSDRIRVLPVRARHDTTLVSAAHEQAPVQVRLLPRELVAATGRGLARAADARRAVARDLAADVVAHLDGQYQVHPREPGAGARALRPADIAVLVRENSQATLVVDALLAVGVPAVSTGRSSVFRTPAAQDWLVLLAALEQPQRTARVRRLAVSCFVGCALADLAAQAEQPAQAGTLDDELAFDLQRWGRTLVQRGAAALFEQVVVDRQVAVRVLAEVGGERLLTDLRHLTHQLHAAWVAGRRSAGALADWLHRQVAEAHTHTSERSRRLETDAAAVQVITVHTSKGLEFPVVLVPFAWNLFDERELLTAVHHDEHGTRRRDVGGPTGPDWIEHQDQHRRETLDEELRLLYVALTRAQSRLTVWWAGATTALTAPLHRLLFTPQPDAGIAASVPVPSDAEAEARLRQLAERSNGTVAVHRVEARPVHRWQPPTDPAPTLAVAHLRRPLDLSWRRTSYSALTAAAHAAAHAATQQDDADSPPQTWEPTPLSEPDDDQRSDEPDDDAPGPVPGHPRDEAQPPPPAPWSPWADLPAGAAFGTVVHTALEHLPDLAHSSDQAVTEAVQVAVQHALNSGAPSELSAGQLVAAIDAAVRTPLGPLADGLALRDIPAADRLNELEFELPLAGGDGIPSGTALDGDADVHLRPGDLLQLATLWRTHCPPGPLAGYGELIPQLLPAVVSSSGPKSAPLVGRAPAPPLRGYLTGSIDAVLRLPAVDGSGSSRYLVVDYKTNRLGDPGQPQTLERYRQPALADAMLRAHYPLQALLYQVALHRFLRWRVPDYHPDEHLGGALYLFLRGMSGTAGDTGVFAWHPGSALVLATSDLLAGRGEPVDPGEVAR